MKKIGFTFCFLTGFLLAAEIKQLEQVEKVSEKTFGFKEIKNCNELPINVMTESNITITKSMMGGFDEKENALYEDLKTGKEIDYLVCKENNTYFLKIKIKNFEIKSKE